MPPSSVQRGLARSADSLKGLAILGIVFYHYYRRLSGVENPFQWWFGPLPQHPQEWGYLGVSLFFILSGWGLAVSASCKSEIFLRRSFWADRVRRVVPLYYLSLIVVFFAFLFLTRQDLHRLVGHFVLKALFLHNFNPETIFSYNSAWWFLGTLPFLYLLFPLLYRGFCKNADWALVLCLTTAFLLSHLLAWGKIASWHPYLAMGGFPLTKVGEFGLGIWLAKREGEAALKFFGVLAILGFLGLLGLRWEFFYPLHPLGFAAPLLALAAWLPLVGLGRLGRSSYGLFLFHRPLIDPWLHGLKSRGFADSAWLAPAIFTILVFAVTAPIEWGMHAAFRRKKSG